LACAAETDVLVNKFELPLEKSDAEFLKAQTKRALAMQDEAAAAEEKAQASLEIAAEIEHPSDLPPSRALSKILSLRKKADGSLEPKMAKKISKRISALRFKIAMSRLKNAAILAAVAGAAVWAFMEIQKRELKSSQYRSALNSISAIENMQNTEKAFAQLQKFEAEFKELSQTPEFSDKVESIKKRLETKKEYLAKLGALLAEAEKFDKTSDDAGAWEGLKTQLDEIDEISGVLEGAELSSAKIKIADAKNKIKGGIDKKLGENSAKLNALIAEANRELAQAGIRNPQSLENIEKAKAAIEAARAIAYNRSIISQPAQKHVEDLEEAEQELDKKADEIAEFNSAIAAVKEAASAEEYFEALENLSENASLPQADKADIAKILEAKDAILFEVYGGIVDLATAKAAPEKFKSPLLNLDEYANIAEIYEATKDGAKVYTIKAPEEEKRVWNGGNEIKQKASVIQSADGASKDEKYSRISMKSSPASGSILEGAKLSKESALAKNALETAANKSLAQALVLVANSDANPMFKLLL
ncbi:MAG: hypothetical protein J6T16_07150, partial [Opitutales bacterium]|nr:hypothetical protein [Opitutales bacterium]